VIYVQATGETHVGIDVEQTYTRYSPMVFRRCRRLLGDEARAEDAMQDVFVKLLLGDERLDDRALAGLLYRIATFVCLNRLRTLRRHPESPDEALLLAIAGSDDLESSAAARGVLARLFRRNEESTRVMATLHYVDGWTLDEVARETAMSVSGVRKRLRALRRELHDLEEAK
jgi:RNA polymerase sigma-70 factor, ECF subfamily